jgi:hypothetical protein
MAPGSVTDPDAMLKPLRYFFLRVYEWKRPSEPESLAVFTALAAASAAVSMHVLTLKVILEMVFKTGLGIPHDRSTSRAVGIAIGILIMAALYRAWIASNRYVTFSEEFQAETRDQRYRRTVLVIVYAVVSFLLPFALTILLRGRF